MRGKKSTLKRLEDEAIANTEAEVITEEVEEEPKKSLVKPLPEEPDVDVVHDWDHPNMLALDPGWVAKHYDPDREVKWMAKDSSLPHHLSREWRIEAEHPDWPDLALCSRPRERAEAEYKHRERRIREQESPVDSSLERLASECEDGNSKYSNYGYSANRPLIDYSQAGPPRQRAGEVEAPSKKKFFFMGG